MSVLIEKVPELLFPISSTSLSQVDPIWSQAQIQDKRSLGLNFVESVIVGAGKAFAERRRKPFGTVVSLSSWFDSQWPFRYFDHVMNVLFAALLVALLILPSCRNEVEETAKEPDLAMEERERLMATGKGIVQELATTLGARLKMALAEGGPVSAVKVCQLEAGPMTDSVSGNHERVTVSRTSLKYRNPKNAPGELDRKVLESWQRALDEGKDLPPLEVELVDESTAVVYKPILLQPLCVNCHGAEEQLLPELVTVLDDLYPEDRARGFKVGDLRGAFRVEIAR